MCITSIALITQNLSAEQQKKIAADVVSNLCSCNENDINQATYVSTLCELIDIVPDLKKEYINSISNYCIFILQRENSSAYYDYILKLSFKFEDLPAALIDFIAGRLSVFVASNPRLFDEKLKDTIFNQEGILQDDELSQREIKSLFEFIEWYFTNNEIFSSSFLKTEIDHLCFIFLTYESFEVSRLASKALRWRMDPICQSSETIDYLWEIIFLLLDSNDNSEVSSGLVLWLRFFNKFGSDVLKEDLDFQKLLSNEKYWYYLRDGLISNVHEHKKFSLTLIQMSVRSLSINLSMPIITWDTAKESYYLSSWKRFCTLYEILGIDTAMNQAEAASNDLIKIISPDSIIPVPFSLTILSVGFKASMERVKIFSLKMVFSLPEESLGLFKYDFKFITSVFLPFTLNASHFNTYRKADGSYECPFGEQLCSFVCRCITSLRTEEDIAKLSDLIFKVLSDHRLSFGVARIYVASGLLKGLEKKHSKALTSNSLEILRSLFESTAEGGILQTTLQTIQLKFLLHLDASNLKIHSLFQTIGFFVQFNGYKAYSENEEFFLDYFNLNFHKDAIFESFRENSSMLDIESFVIFLSCLLRNKLAVSKLIPYILGYPKCTELLIQIPNTKIQFNDIFYEPLIISKIEKMVNDMVLGSRNLHINVYADSKNLLSNKKLFSDQFWESVNLSPLFEQVSSDLNEISNLELIRYSIAQFKFFTNCFVSCVFNENFTITLESLVKILKNSFKNIPKGSDKTFYKAKDELYALVLNSIEILFKVTQFSNQFKKEILEVSSEAVTMSEYYCHSANVSLLTRLLDCDNSKNGTSLEETKRIVLILHMIWQDLIRDRLILTQRDLHQNFIKLLLHKTLLKFSIDDIELANDIFEIANEVIDNSFSRKALLPHFFDAISDYQTSDNGSFEKTSWLGKLLVRGNFLYQSDHHIFKLDSVIGNAYDKNLNMLGISLYTQIYGKPEIGYRVYINVIIASIKSSEFVLSIWKYIFDNENVFHLLQPIKRTDAQEQWKRMQLLMILLLTMEVLHDSDLLKFVNNLILPRLFKEASPLCRMYIEWIVAYTVLRCPSAENALFSQFKKGVETQQPLVITLFERISVLVAQQFTPEKESEFLSKLTVNVVIPSATSNRALNRHFSSSMACVIYQEVKNKGLIFPSYLEEALSNIYKVAVMSEGYGQYRTGDALLWNVIGDLNLVSINGGVLLKISDREIDAIYEKDWNIYVTEAQKALLRYPIGHDEDDKWITKGRSNEVKIEAYHVHVGEENESSLLQTKSGAWSTVMEVDDNVRAAAHVKRSPLIVVSSLVDKPVNLGGICRLCDCLGAGWMTVDNISVKENPEFKSVAVTADRWMPMIEVKMDDIIEFMRLKKKEGYTLIGLEQTDKSVELNGDLKFPEKSLILLGKEREGIPGNLLSELDTCVIIKQVGIVRSMNIQTATAVIVHAYSSQHC